MRIDFEHTQAAHCENGVTINLLKHNGIHQLTEPLAFGIGSGLFYIHIPLLKINHGPAISFRNMPGVIFKRTCKSLDIPVSRKKFSSPEKAQKELNEILESGIPVGCQVGVFHLPYFPKEYRFHFNAHNLVVFGKQNGHYLISDPVMETTTTLTPDELQRVRFAKGALAPKGQMYFPKEKKQVSSEQIKRAIAAGIKLNIRDMLHIPLPFTGVRGIRFTANRIRKWRDKLGLRKAGMYLAQLVRMQEEIGTGGGGFRYIYAAFLQQAHTYHPNDVLLATSTKITASGDLWRSAAMQAAGIFKGRITAQQDFDEMANYLFRIADMEQRAFEDLSKVKWH